MNRLDSENKLSQNIFNLIPSIIRKLEEEKDKQESYDLSILSNKELYIYNVSLSVINISSHFDRMNQSILYLSNFRQTKKLKEAGITRYDYLKYHIENYYISVTGLFDRALILVNDVFTLGNPLSNCKEYIILKNEFLVGFTTNNILNELSKIVGQHRKERNAIIHHNEYSSKELTSLGKLFFIQRENGEETIPIWFTKLEADKYVKSKKVEFANEIDKMIDTFDRLYNELFFVFNRKLSTFTK
jgi:hypothetical protein